jgi:hypothetical protein
MNKTLKIVSKAMVYPVILAALLVGLLRGIVPTIWGSHSDLALFLAPVVAVLGLVGLLWLTVKAVQDIKNTQ